MTTRRYSYEAKALEPFRKVVKQRGLSATGGQSAPNRIVIQGNLYFQFGDLRVDLDGRHIVIEVESAGGVTNLAKYWYCLQSRLVPKKIDLLHLFLQSAPGDYGSHMAIWDLLTEEIVKRFPRNFSARRFTYRREWLRRDIRPAVKYFESLLDSTADRSRENDAK